MDMMAGIGVRVALLALAQSPDALYQEGIRSLEGGRAGEAIPILERAARAARTNAQYWKAYGVAIATTGDYAAAIEPFENACKLDPRLVDACYYYGRALYAADRYQEALVPLKRALEVDADKTRGETAIGQALEALGRDAEAEKSYRSAINRGPSTAARIAYGRFLVRQNRLPEALPVLEAAQMPESPEALMEYARALLQADRNEASVERLTRLIAIAPRDAAARFLLAKAYRRLGRSADAVRQEQAALEIQGSSTSK
jgi:Flp pilus assembly protein TadD